MSKKYLLTGAGFSKSFGALLTSELTAIFFNSLIQEKDIQFLKKVKHIWRNKERNCQKLTKIQKIKEKEVKMK